MVDIVDDGYCSLAGSILSDLSMYLVNPTHALPFLELMRSATSRSRARFGS